MYIYRKMGVRCVDINQRLQRSIEPRPHYDRDALREGAAILRVPGRALALITNLLFCLLVVFSCLMFADLPQLALLGDEIDTDHTRYVAVQAVSWVLLALLLLGVAAPVLLGRLRMAGRMCRGEEPLQIEAFYYFTDRRRYLRALRVSLLTALCIALTLVVPVLLFGGSIVLFQYVLTEELGLLIALAVLAVLLVLCAAFTLVVLLVAGLWLLFPAIAVGNETISARAALSRALACGSRNLGTVFRFSLRSLCWLLLSAVTLGVLFVLWLSHYYVLSYLRLSMTLCPKERESL